MIAEAAPSQASGSLIAGRYLVERLLGQGGMGAVYVVVDTQTGARLALKRLNAAARPEVSALFEREYQTLSGLRHPGIVEVYEYGGDGESAFYTMEVVEGIDLGQRAPMPWREACAYLREAASILGVLHARHLLHRDLSPRNLLRTASGRLKLIDFGALAPFGASRDIVGTPPFVPPEMLRGQALDQRSDLFALGALGYYLLTGAHAFPARTFSALEQLHREQPVAPSRRLARSDLVSDDPVPPELDALLLALLRVDLSERPASTGELIDRLGIIADLEPEAQHGSAQGYLDSKVFVGRERERERVLARLAQARSGGVQTILLEAASGLGRTGLMQELAVGARLSGASVMVVTAQADEQPFGAASRLALQLLNGLPQQAREAAQARRAELAMLSSDVCARLGEPPGSYVGQADVEGRVRLQVALCDWIAAVANMQLVALFIDDLHALDEESITLLAALAQLPGAPKLLLFATADLHKMRRPSAALQSFAAGAARLTLRPLTAAETLLLMRSVFGAVPFLERTAERLFRVSSGHPAHCLALAQHLIRANLARYTDGIWSLPSELDESALPVSHEGAQVARLTRLSSAARTVAQALSIQHEGGLSEALCASLSGSSLAVVMPQLTELLAVGILRQAPDGLHFVHEAMRSALHAELGEARRMRAHRVLGEARLASSAGDRVELLRASLHLLRGGEVSRSLALIRTAGANQGTETLRLTAPLFEEIYELVCTLGLDAHARVTPLANLALAGYHVDRRHGRHTDDTLQVFEQVLHLKRFRRLSRWVGAKPALVVTLLCALVGAFRRRAYSPSLKLLISHCMRSFVALVGASTCCIDSVQANRCARVLQPFLALGPRHGASVAAEIAVLFAKGIEDRPASSVAGLRAMIERIERNEPMREVTPKVRTEALAGCLFMLGISSTWRDDPEALEVADRLDTFSPLYALGADHLRANYHANQGNLEREEHFRRRVELHAMRLGTTWQVETWAPADAIRTALRTHDALLAKRAAENLARLAVDIPSLRREEQLARGTYLMLRGKYRKAIPLLDRDEVPLATVGWARSRGSLARCYNGMGDHTRALSICLDALSRLTPGDLDYPGLNLNVQIELALAEAGLGNFDAASERLAALLEHHGPNRGVLTLGALHEARCRVAILAGDSAGARAHLVQMSAALRPTGIASLCDLVDALETQLRGPGGACEPQQDLNTLAASELADHRLSRVQELLTQITEGSSLDRAQRALQVAMEFSNARSGFMVIPDGGEGSFVAFGQEEPDLAMASWARHSLNAGPSEEVTATAFAGDLTSSDTQHSRTFAGLRYVFIPLRPRGEGVPIAGLALGFDSHAPRVPDLPVLRALAFHLQASGAPSPVHRAYSART